MRNAGKKPISRRRMGIRGRFTKGNTHNQRGHRKSYKSEDIEEHQPVVETGLETETEMGKKERAGTEIAPTVELRLWGCVLLIFYKNVYSKRSHAFPPNSNINIYHNQPFGFSL
jgi:hypothetical protein